MVGVLFKGSLTRGDEDGLRTNMQITNVSIARDSNGKISATSFMQTKEPVETTIVTFHMAADGSGSLRRTHSSGDNAQAQANAFSFNNLSALNRFNEIYDEFLDSNIRHDLRGILSAASVNRLTGEMNRFVTHEIGRTLVTKLGGSRGGGGQALGG